MPCLRKSLANKSSVSRFRFPRIRDITAERFSLVKTSGIGLSGNCSGVELVLFAVEKAGVGEQSHDFAEPWIGAVHKIAELPGVGQARFGDDAAFNVLHGFWIPEEAENRFTFLLIGDNNYHALRWKYMCGALFSIMFPNSRVSR